MYIKKNSKEVSDFVVVIVGMELASAHPPHSPFALSSSCLHSKDRFGVKTIILPSFKVNHVFKQSLSCFKNIKS
jgi:hypothetical protein